MINNTFYQLRSVIQFAFGVAPSGQTSMNRGDLGGCHTGWIRTESRFKSFERQFVFSARLGDHSTIL